MPLLLPALIARQSATLLNRGDPRALLWCRMAVFAEPQSAQAWYDLGLAYKQRSQWHPSQKANFRAAQLDPEHQAAWWNLGIAATARGDWSTARRAWTRYGIDLPIGDGPPDMQFGLTPIRLHPFGNAEIVWTQRLDPARAQILSIPSPETGFRHGDIVLHDGYPAGQREYQGQTLTIFNALQLLVASPLSTYRARLQKQPDDQLADLAALAQSHSLAVQNWTESVRQISREQTQIPETFNVAAPSQFAELGIAARSEKEVRSFLSDLRRARPDRRLKDLDLAVPGSTVRGSTGVPRHS